MLTLDPRETTSATVKNEDYSYCCQSPAFGAPELLKTWKKTVMAEVLIVLFLHVHFGLIHVDVLIEISSHLSQ